MQLGPVHAVSSPTEDEIAWAREVITTFEAYAGLEA